MPGTDSHSTRRAQTTGISKQCKKRNSSKSKRQVITFTAYINNSEVQPKIAEDCLEISRQCTAPSTPKQLSPQSLDKSPPPPPQVVLFYDHINGNSPTQRNHEEAIRYCRSFGHELSSTRTRLQSLLPAKKDVTCIADYASRWMTLYHGLYSLTYTFRTGYQLIATYDRMQSSDVDPVLLASYVLCLAISLQQASSDIVVCKLSRNEYVIQVCDAVEEVIARKSVLAGTVEGLEACMLLLMLSVHHLICLRYANTI